MRSFRARLTFSYTVLVAFVLGIVTIVASLFAFEFLTRSTLDALASSASTAEAIVRAHPHASRADLEQLIVAATPRNSVHIIVLPQEAERRLPPPPRYAPSQITLPSLLGLRPHVVHVQNATILVAPDLRRIDEALRWYLEVLAASLLGAIVLAWLIARWITAQAIAPLTTVTGELRRFAGGDFRPRAVTTHDRGELGELIEAYNGAAGQVAAAFSERTRVEEHMRRFIAEAGHELRTPLTVVIGYLNVLERGGLDDPTIRRKAFETLDIETLRMRTLVERLMALAKLERPEPSQVGPVHVREVAAGAIAEVVAARGGDVALAGEGDGEVMADPAELHEAVSNLVDNAVKYGERTPVRVEIENDHDDIVIRVRDRGPGIPANERPRIFERFFRGEQRADIEGSGLGLAIVERAVTRSGGKVELENGDPGRTTFAIRLRSSSARSRQTAPLHVG